VLKIEAIQTAHGEFVDIAKKWIEVSSLQNSAGKSGDSKFINEASEILKALSEQQKKAMGSLLAT
jgi:hypothetical protein